MKHYLVNKKKVEIIKENPAAVIVSKINAKGREDKDDAFFIGDLGDVVQKYYLWRKLLPRVEPHYAVKCNDDPAVLAVLAQLGIGFDCASKSEIQKILDMKVCPDRIVYANPCKQNSHIKFAAKHSVSLMTFDNEFELHKVKASFPGAKLVLRILPPDDTKSQCQLGMKYGCHPKHAARLLCVAQELGLSVVGVSFHVGSGCYDATAFSAAVVSARQVFDIATSLGFHLDLLDIGGGFPGQRSAKITFQEIVDELSPALEKHFPKSTGVRIISEPGRYFVASAFTLAVNVIAKRKVPRDLPYNDDVELTENDEPMFMYYVNDGVYGSFNCLLYDHAIVEPTLLESNNGDQPRYTSSIWGPTCDGLDCISEQCQLPELVTGDWIVFPDMGAYTMCAASTFNGMPKPRCYYVVHKASWEKLDVEPCTASSGGATNTCSLIKPMKMGYDLDIDRYARADMEDLPAN